LQVAGFFVAPNLLALKPNKKAAAGVQAPAAG
jgi:hypothetical protein